MLYNAILKVHIYTPAMADLAKILHTVFIRLSRFWHFKLLVLIYLFIMIWRDQSWVLTYTCSIGLVSVASHW